MAEELLEKIPPERRWAITAKTLWRFTVLGGDKIIASILGKGEGIIAPVMGAEKWKEINKKIYSDGGQIMMPWVKETFNIPVEDAIGACKLVIVAAALINGPEQEYEIVEMTPERAVDKTTNCVCWERYNEFEVDSEHRACDPACQVWTEEGLKAVNPKIGFKLTKARPRGDPYCEFVYEFKEE
jgi:hypothetical protein